MQFSREKNCLFRFLQMQKRNIKWKWFIFFCCCSNAEHLFHLFLSNERKQCSEHILGYRCSFRPNCARQKKTKHSKCEMRQKSLFSPPIWMDTVRFLQWVSLCLNCKKLISYWYSTDRWWYQMFDAFWSNFIWFSVIQFRIFRLHNRTYRSKISVCCVFAQQKSIMRLVCVGGLKSLGVTYLGNQATMPCNAIQFNSFTWPLFSNNNYLDTIYDFPTHNGSKRHIYTHNGKSHWYGEKWHFLSSFVTQCLSFSFTLVRSSLFCVFFIMFVSKTKSSKAKKKSSIKWCMYRTGILLYLIFSVVKIDDFQSLFLSVYMLCVHK